MTVDVRQKPGRKPKIRPEHQTILTNTAQFDPGPPIEVPPPPTEDEVKRKTEEEILSAVAVERKELITLQNALEHELREHGEEVAIVGDYTGRIEEKMSRIPAQPAVDAEARNALLEEIGRGKKDQSELSRFDQAHKKALKEWAGVKESVEAQCEPLVATRHAMDLAARRSEKRIVGLQAAIKAGTIAFLRADGERLGMEYRNAAQLVELKLFSVVNVGDALRRLDSPNDWGSDFMELRIPSSGPAAGSIFAPSRFHSAPLTIVGVLSVEEYGRLDAVEDIQLAEYAEQGLKLAIPPSPTRIAREAPPAPPAEPRPIIQDVPAAVTYIERPDPESELPGFAITSDSTEVFPA